MPEEMIEKYVSGDRDRRVQHPRETALERVSGELRRAELIWSQENRGGMVEFLGDRHIILWNFDVGSTELKLAHIQALDMIAKAWQVARLHSASSVIIEGHASRSGDAAENLMLSEHRSRSVAHYLADRGIERHRMEVNYNGWERPWFPNITGAGMARNRRVEVRIVTPQETKTTVPISRKPFELNPVWRDAQWSEIIPGIALELKLPIELPPSSVLNGRLMLYPSAEARIRLTVAGKHTESLKLGVAAGKWDLDLEFKKMISDSVAFKIDSNGKLAVEVGGRLLKVEGEVKAADPIKPYSINFTGPGPQLPTIERDEIKIKPDVLEVKIKLAFGPGPKAGTDATRLLIRSGPAGIIVLTIAGTATVTYFIAYVVEAAQAKGLSHKRKVAYRAGYAWRVASEALVGGPGREGITGVEAWRAELYDAAWQGWQFAEDSIRALSSVERSAVMQGLKLRYGNTIERMAQSILVQIGGYKDDMRRPPDDIRDLI